MRFIIGFILLSLVGTGALDAEELRGYGKVEAKFKANEAIFQCEDSLHADRLLGKLLADLFWDAGKKHIIRKVKIRGREVPVHLYKGYGTFVVGAVKDRVIALGARNIKTLISLVKKRPELLRRGARFKPSRPYPVYLDYYDLRAVKSFLHPLHSPEKLGIRSHYKFAKRFGISLSFQALGMGFYSPAPGVIQWSPADFEIENAKKNGLMIVPAFGVYSAPLWLFNYSPEDILAYDPHLVAGTWGNIGQSGSRHVSAWAKKETQDREDAYLQAIARRYKDNPAVGGYGIYAGAPGPEMGFHHASGIFMDYSSAARQGFRKYLKEVKKFSLDDMGKRWHGNKNHYNSWKEVDIPSTFEFFGGFGKDTFNMLRGWKVQEEGNQKETAFEEWPRMIFDDGSWQTTDLAPSQKQLLLVPKKNRPAWYRLEFNPSRWLSSTKGKEVFLVINAWSQDYVDVWLNGLYLGKHRSKLGDVGPLGLRVTEVLKRGLNLLVVRTPAGRIYGPVFLTRQEPGYYPFLGQYQNARYVDLRDFQAYSVYRRHDRVIRAVVAAAPDMPLMLTPGGSLEIADYVGRLSRSYGMHAQFSGGGNFPPPWAGLGYPQGFYASTEPGSTIMEPDWLQRIWGWELMSGHSSFSFFWDIEHYQLVEEKSGWFTRNRRLMELFGKSLWKKPGIALLLPVRMYLYKIPGYPGWAWDIGKGELQEAHYNVVYITEQGVKDGIAKDYPVLFDTGTVVMDEELVAALEDYVRGGGTFVALHMTGKHSLTKTDTWPIKRLTGFNVEGEKKGKISFLADPPLFKSWANRKFMGEGSFIDWKGNQHAEGVGKGLKKKAEDSQPIALWDDGTIAVGYRKLGKGQVIVLASTFWRYGKDVEKTSFFRSQKEIEREFFNMLFDELGVKKNARASEPNVWARSFITKNGLQNWLIAFNNTNLRKKEVEVAIRLRKKPRLVIDLLKNTPVPFSYENGWVSVKGVNFEPWTTHAYAIKRASLIGGTPFWWEEKVKYWKKPKVAPVKRASAREEVISFERWRVTKATEKTKGLDWTKPEFDDSAWKEKASEVWFEPEGKGITYLYRHIFRTLRSWNGSKVILGLCSFDTPIVFGDATFYVNGNKVATYRTRGWSQTYNYDITPYLKADKNVLAIEEKLKPEDKYAGEHFAGISGAIFIYAEPRFEEERVLRNWYAYDKELKEKRVSVPAELKVNHLMQELTIPKKWKNKTVFLHLESNKQWLGLVMINDRPINYNQYLHPYGLRVEVNLTPYLRFGEKNILELYPRDGSGGYSREGSLNIQKILIGTRP